MSKTTRSWISAALAVAAVIVLFRAFDFAERKASSPQPVKSATAKAPALPLPVDRAAMGYDVLILLNDEHVQAELHLDPAGLAAIASITDEHLQQAGRMFHEHRAGRTTQGERGANDSSEYDAARRELSTASGRGAAEALSPEQKARLDQVLFQLRSLEIYAMPEFAEALQLSAAQRQSIAQIRRQVEGVAAELRRQLRDKKLDRPTYERHVQQALVASETSIERHLTDDQCQTVAQWRGPRMAFGRMHLRMSIRTQLRYEGDQGLVRVSGP